MKTRDRGADSLRCPICQRSFFYMGVSYPDEESINKHVIRCSSSGASQPRNFAGSSALCHDSKRVVNGGCSSSDKAITYGKNKAHAPVTEKDHHSGSSSRSIKGLGPPSRVTDSTSRDAVPSRPSRGITESHHTSPQKIVLHTEKEAPPSTNLQASKHHSDSDQTEKLNCSVPSPISSAIRRKRNRCGGHWMCPICNRSFLSFTDEGAYQHVLSCSATPPKEAAELQGNQEDQQRKTCNKLLKPRGGEKNQEHQNVLPQTNDSCCVKHSKNLNSNKKPGAWTKQDEKSDKNDHGVAKPMKFAASRLLSTRVNKHNLSTHGRAVLTGKETVLQDQCKILPHGSGHVEKRPENCAMRIEGLRKELSSTTGGEKTQIPDANDDKHEGKGSQDTMFTFSPKQCIANKRDCLDVHNIDYGKGTKKKKLSPRAKMEVDAKECSPGSKPTFCVESSEGKRPTRRGKSECPICRRTFNVLSTSVSEMNRHVLLCSEAQNRSANRYENPLFSRLASFSSSPSIFRGKWRQEKSPVRNLDESRSRAIQQTRAETLRSFARSGTEEVMGRILLRSMPKGTDEK